MSDVRSPSLWATIASDYGLDEPLGESAEVSIVRRRRRSYNNSERDPRASVELVRDDGVLRWVYVPPRAATRQGRRSYRSLHVAPGDVIQRYAFHEGGSTA